MSFKSVEYGFRFAKSLPWRIIYPFRNQALPKFVQSMASRFLHSIWQTETCVDAETVFDSFIPEQGKSKA